MSLCSNERLVTAEMPNRTMVVLLVTFISVFLAQMIVPPFARFAETWLALDTGAVFRHGRLWQLVTALFLHGSIVHFLSNMMFFWLFGTALASAWRRNEFLLFFFVCGIFSFLCFYGVNAWRAESARGVGASGAVFGLMIAYAMVFGDRIILAFFLIPMPVRYFVAICFALEILLLWVGQADGVAHIAHVGGGVCGAVYLKLVWRWQERRAGRAIGPASTRSRIAGLEVMDSDSRR